MSLLFYQNCHYLCHINMTRQRQKELFARLLLWMYIPMLLASVLHVHPADTTLVCDDCAHHVSHAPHFMSLEKSCHDCVLCHFSNTVYLAAPVVVLAAVLPCAATRPMQICSLPPLPYTGRCSDRAPPFLN